MIPMDDVAMLIEIRGIYDGWSVAKMKDGTYRNRWPEDDPRHTPTADCIRKMEEQDRLSGWQDVDRSEQAPEG